MATISKVTLHKVFGVTYSQKAISATEWIVEIEGDAGHVFIQVPDGTTPNDMHDFILTSYELYAVMPKSAP